MVFPVSSNIHAAEAHVNPSTSHPRLVQLLSFLQQDPGNPILLQDTFDTALRTHTWSVAEEMVQRGLRLEHDRWGWQSRHAQLLLASQHWTDAHVALTAMRTDPMLPANLLPVLNHDLAFAALHLGRFDEGLACLESVIGPVSAEQPLAPSTQLLWLRLLHRCRRLAEAMAWAKARWACGTLDPVAAGVASLIALDAADFEFSLRWADAALGSGAEQLEALVARASLALAQRDAESARKLLARARHLNPNDGRTWSALGFTELLEQNLEAASANFSTAVRQMPDHIGTWHGLGWVAMLKNDLEKAKAVFVHAVDMDRNFAESHGSLAIVLAKEGNTADAELEIKLALRLDRNCLSARYAQAIINGDAHDLKKFHELVERLLGQQAAPLGGRLVDVVMPKNQK
jgi:tetratricopeptide (TPR) repeat protein